MIGPNIITIDGWQRLKPPKRNRRVYSYFTDEEYAALVELAEINQRSIANLVRLILEQYLLDPYLKQAAAAPEQQEQAQQQPREDTLRRAAAAQERQLRELQAADHNRAVRESSR